MHICSYPAHFLLTTYSPDPLETEPLLEEYVEASVAVGSGYTESKWVSEQILREAGRQTSLKSLIVRVGQLCGGLNGHWNSNEWFPSMVQSAEVVGCFPDDEKVSFVSNI